MPAPEKAGEEPEAPPPDRNKKAQGGDEGGISGEVLESLGDLIPGLRGLLRGLKRWGPFRERLAEVDEEIEARLRGGSAREDLDEAWRRRRPPPGAIPRAGAIPRGQPRARPSGQRRSWKAAKGELSREMVADVFEEGEEVRVVADMPGLKQETLQIDLQGDQLTISAESSWRRHRHRVQLPSSPLTIQKTSYKNGILEVRLGKADGPEHR